MKSVKAGTPRGQWVELRRDCSVGFGTGATSNA
jgi:hypothetical protein